MKTCSGCKENKPLSEFAKSKARKDGCQAYCKPCHRDRNAASRAKNPERYREASRRFFANHPEYARRKAQEARFGKYGITAEDYERMLAEQGGACAICGDTEADARGLQLHIDHDHKTGAVRGLLCGNCNHAIGKLGDDPVLIRKAADYLEAHRG